MGEKKNAKQGGHKALYRKYRSKTLDEVVGQEHITQTLKNALKQKKINHAYLFTGPRGTGKTSIARILAHEINDLPYNDDSTHLDIIEIDAASNRRIDDIRDLKEKVNIAPLFAKYKVYIIDEVHMLTNESFNALLKTLEEPPEHVVFILATTEVHKLPATILSRTQRHTVRLIAKNKVKKHLAYIAKSEGLTIDEDALELLAEHGGGSFRDSISLLDQMSAATDTITRDLIETLLGLAPKPLLNSLYKNALNGGAKQLLQDLEELLSIGLSPGAIALQLVNLIRSSIIENNEDRLVALMSDLLTVQNAQYPELKLETVLLNVNPKKATTTAAISEPQKPLINPAPNKETLKEKQTPSKEVKDESKLPEKPRQIITKPAVSPKSTGTFNPDEHWQTVLQKTKEKNNPLYTVLRLATPELEGTELVLIFSFPFHQKKLDEPKYKAVISEIITEVSGDSVSIKSIVDKSRVKASSPSEKNSVDPAHASLISNVQDIMGGGEVVEL